MKLSAKTEYACLAMLQLAADYEAVRPAPLRTLSERQRIPEGFLVQILQDLRRAGLVASLRGASGGYRLSRAPDQINLAQVIAAIEGVDPPTADETTATPLAGVLHSVCDDLRRVENERLASLSLAELVDQSAAAAVEPMWYI